jgi:putative restriction endonuclease
LRATFAVTDSNWLASIRESETTEANFWQPRPTRVSDKPGTPWIFKVRGEDRVAGFGFFSYWTEMPLVVAWEYFGRSNGVRAIGEMRARVDGLRNGVKGDDRVGCVILSDVVVLPESEWITAPQDWRRQIVRIVGYDLDQGEGGRVWSQLRSLDSRVARDSSPLIITPGGYTEPSLVARRRGQGAFRSMVMDAYERRCAVTGERTLPVLEAAHIRPYAQQPIHEVSNGILLRSDLHRLYDTGLVTIAPDLTFRVSPSIERDYSNGRIYYALDGKTIRIPTDRSSMPNAEALDWHAANVFRP